MSRKRSTLMIVSENYGINISVANNFSHIFGVLVFCRITEKCSKAKSLRWRTLWKTLLKKIKITKETSFLELGQTNRVTKATRMTLAILRLKTLHWKEQGETRRIDRQSVARSQRMLSILRFLKRSITKTRKCNRLSKWFWIKKTHLTHTTRAGLSNLI